MFRLYSKGCEYAIRALVHAAPKKKGERFKAKAICEKAGIPESFTRKVFRLLVHAGFLEALRGPGGGYALLEDPERISLLEIIKAVDGADTFAPDGKNEAYFARIVGRGAGGTIAFTILWREVGGPLIEWDMVFNTKFDWSLSGEADKMDFLNITAHEVGHAAGMGHTDTDVGCVDQTMYPTASKGETIKRDLDVGDEAGIKALYYQ
ncbi:MAG: Rrf2 family transcriptional regulator [Nitrospinae bacterium]|nr:Rrf2 family transcriptional regulator [Nitrospinota bacterium]